MASFRTVGVEIGTSGIRAIELSIGAQYPALITYGQMPLPPKAVVDGEIVNRTAVVEQLKYLWSESDFSTKRVTVGVAGLRAIIRDIEIGNVPDKELEGVIKFQGQEIIPFPAEQAILSSRLIGDITKSDGAIAKKVLIAAAHRGLVEPMLSVLVDAGLDPIAVNLSALAIIRAATIGLDPIQGAEAIVSIGAGLTVVVVHENGVPKFVRTIGQGGDNVTEAIAASLDSPFEDAERLKWNLTLPGPQYATALNVAIQTTTSLVNEVKNSVDYFDNQSSDSKIQRVIVTGGGSLLEGLLARIQQPLRVPVVMARPLAGIDTSGYAMVPEDLAKLEPTLTTVLGLALPEPSGVKPLNLLPQEITEKQTAAKIRKRVVTVCALVILVLLVYLGYGVFQYFSSKSDVNTLTVQNSELQSQVKALNKIASQNSELNSFVTTLTPLIKYEVNWPAVVSELQKDLLPNQYITTISFTDYSPNATEPASITSTTSSSSPTSSLTSNGQPVTPSDLVASLTVTVYGLNGYSDLGNWLGSMNKDPMFTSPVVTATNELTSSASTAASNIPITFNASFYVTTVALSNRYKEFQVNN
jgi:type IV pilus assembly protein PilM